jgi:hypothetical protein
MLKKIVATLSAWVLIIQSPVSTMAAYTTPAAAMEADISQWILQSIWDSNINSQQWIPNFKPTFREQFYINKITKQLETIIEKADTNEAKMQRTINVNILLLDTLVANSKPYIEKSIAANNDPEKLEAIQKEMKAAHFESKAKIIWLAMMQISEKYLWPQMEEYMSFAANFQEEPNQNDINTIVQKTTTLYNMFDNAFENYAPTINLLLKDYIGVLSKDLFHHIRVIMFIGLQMLVEESSKESELSIVWEPLKKEKMEKIVGFVKNALENSDSRTKIAYNISIDIVAAQWGDVETYWNSIKGGFKKEFVDMVDMGIPMVKSKMEWVQNRAKDTKIKADIQQIWSALAVYWSDNGNFIKLHQFTNSQQLREPLVLNASYLTEMPQNIDGTPYRFSTLKRNNSTKDDAFMLLWKVEDTSIANRIDEDWWLTSDKNLSAMDVSIIENSQCRDITIWTKDSLKDCTILPNSTKLSYIYTY